MAHIKTLVVNTISFTTRGFYWNSKNFTTFTDDNGNKTYLINGKEVSKEDGNKEYLNMKNSNKSWRESLDGKKYFKRQWDSYKKLKGKGYKKEQFYLYPEQTFKQEVTEQDITYEELINNLEKLIDHYTQYIDDYKQQKQAEAHNNEIRKKIDKLNKLISERKHK